MSKRIGHTWCLKISPHPYNPPSHHDIWTVYKCYHLFALPTTLPFFQPHMASILPYSLSKWSTWATQYLSSRIYVFTHIIIQSFQCDISIFINVHICAQGFVFIIIAYKINILFCISLFLFNNTVWKNPEVNCWSV